MTVNIMPMFSLKIIHRLSEKICIESINAVAVLEVLALLPLGCIKKTLFSKISKVQPTKHQPGGLV